eukprot:CFRG4359T1
MLDNLFKTSAAHGTYRNSVQWVFGWILVGFRLDSTRLCGLSRWLTSLTPGRRLTPRCVGSGRRSAFADCRRSVERCACAPNRLLADYFLDVRRFGVSIGCKEY